MVIGYGNISIDDNIDPARPVALKGWLVPDITIMVQVSDGPMVSSAGRYFGRLHDLMAERLDRVFKMFFTPMFQQSSIDADMGNANAGVTRNSIKES